MERATCGQAAYTWRTPHLLSKRVIRGGGLCLRSSLKLASLRSRQTNSLWLQGFRHPPLSHQRMDAVVAPQDPQRLDAGEAPWTARPGNETTSWGVWCLASCWVEFPWNYLIHSDSFWFILIHSDSWFLTGVGWKQREALHHIRNIPKQHLRQRLRLTQSEI